MTVIKRLVICFLLVFGVGEVFASGISSAILRRDDVKRMERELNRGADVNDSDWFGRTALMRAIRFSALDCAELLLEKGAGIDEKDKNGWTALMWASVECSTSAVKMLLEKGADAAIRDKLGYNALMLAEDKGSCGGVCDMLKEALKKNMREEGELRPDEGSTAK